jgi:hypothetical protein
MWIFGLLIMIVWLKEGGPCDSVLSLEGGSLIFSNLSTLMAITITKIINLSKGYFL